MQKSTEPAYPISSVDTALRLILLFRQHRSLRLSDAAAELGVAPSTAHRQLAMLAYHGFVRQRDGSKSYEAGPALVEVGRAVVRQMDLRATAHETLEALAGDFDETVHLASLEGGLVRYLDAVESTRALRVALRTGRTLPAHCTSVGKALLAQLPPEQVRALYPRAHLPAETDRSITELADLERELERVRRRGYALNSGESEEGVTAVAAPVFDPARGAVAALSVAAPSLRVPTRRVKEIGEGVVRRAGELAGLLAEALPSA